MANTLARSEQTESLVPVTPKEKELCVRAHKELEYAAMTIHRAHLLLTLMESARFSDDAAQAHMLSEIALELLTFAGERATDAAEFFEGDVRHG